VSLQAVRAGGCIVMIAKMGIGDLAERVSAGGGIHCDASATPGVVVPETQVQAARVLRSNIIYVAMAFSFYFFKRSILTNLFDFLKILAGFPQLSMWSHLLSSSYTGN
jgi:hypothetical protein